MITVENIACSTPAVESPRASTFTKNWRYFHNAITFQVEDQLFRESTRYFTVHSRFFRELLIAASGDPSPAGNSDDNPIKLNGVRAKEFELLLSIVYPINPFQELNITHDEWKILIKLSAMWGMANLHALCVKKLSPLPTSMSLMQKILFSRDYMVGSWLMEAYGELSRRKETISDEEVQELGTQAAIQILRVREEWLVANTYRSFRSYRSLQMQPLSNHREVIRNAFHKELEELMCKGIMIYGEDFVWLLDDVGVKTSSEDGGNSTSELPAGSDRYIPPLATSSLDSDFESVAEKPKKKKKSANKSYISTLRK